MANPGYKIVALPTVSANNKILVNAKIYDASDSELLDTNFEFDPTVTASEITDTLEQAVVDLNTTATVPDPSDLDLTIGTIIRVALS
ncbi:MAG: hypothetical protein A2309_02945 [Bacteroidetes bacterium RIFOXYB2_FULL_35_7]|nr:MAG: hypothetical protein A2309_02945 [Bacteroidetes bacterium RIFOXYB2_FULL_35_7]OGH90942.1 MAG: hypothetical protein A2479_04805 [Candidatus Magasanikbacteria bacterium RIFOXYC2_FULL_39_8]